MSTPAGYYANIAQALEETVDQMDQTPGDPVDDLFILLAALAGSKEVSLEETETARAEVLAWLTNMEAS